MEQNGFTESIVGLLNDLKRKFINGSEVLDLLPGSVTGVLYKGTEQREK